MGWWWRLAAVGACGGWRRLHNLAAMCYVHAIQCSYHACLPACLQYATCRLFTCPFLSAALLPAPLPCKILMAQSPS